MGLERGARQMRCKILMNIFAQKQLPLFIPSSCVLIDEAVVERSMRSLATADAFRRIVHLGFF